MGSSPPSRLTSLQRDLLLAFFKGEQRFFLTGGAALAGFYFGHRDTEDLDLFTVPGTDLTEAAQRFTAAAAEAGVEVVRTRSHPDFCRLTARRGAEATIVDLVVDRAPMVDPEKATFGSVRVDTLREIAANKICTLISRSEIKDLTDLKQLVEAGVDLHQAFEDASRKEGSADPATLAWILDELVIGPTARLPGGIDPRSLDEFRRKLVVRLRSEAFAMARKKP